MAVLRLMISSTLVTAHRQIGRLLALENPAGVDAELDDSRPLHCSVAHQAAGRGESREFEDRRHRMAGRQCARSVRCWLLKNGSAPITSAPARDLDQCCKDGIEISFGARLQDLELQPERAAAACTSLHSGLGSQPDWSD